MEFSPIIVVLQYLSTLLSGRGSRLLLLLRACGCKTWESFCEQCPSLVRDFRTAISSASSWVYRRHWIELRKAPWSLVALVDKRLPMDRRLACARKFMRKHSCCVRAGLARKLSELLEAYGSVELLFSEVVNRHLHLSWATKWCQHAMRICAVIVQMASHLRWDVPSQFVLRICPACSHHFLCAWFDA